MQKAENTQVHWNILHSLMGNTDKCSSNPQNSVYYSNCKKCLEYDSLVKVSSQILFLRDITNEVSLIHPGSQSAPASYQFASYAVRYEQIPSEHLQHSTKILFSGPFDQKY